MTTTSTQTRRREELVRLAPWIILLVYAVWIIVLLPEHEPWADEAQAWLLARDASIPDLLWKYLRYEGTPGLWHLLLVIPAKLGMPYFALTIVGALGGFAGVFLLVRYSPFPLWLKALLPFTYFLAYQYAVVARSYCLLAPILFGTAIFHRQSAVRFWPFAVCLALLSHVSLHGTLIAGAIWVVQVGALLRDYRRGESAVRGQLACLSVLAANFLLIVWQMIPPTDMTLPSPNLDAAGSARVALMAISQALAGNALFSIVLVVLVLPLLYRGRNVTIFLLAAALLLALMAFRYFAFWHAGTITVLYFFSIWLALDALAVAEAKFGTTPSPWPRLLAYTSVGLLCVIQVREAVMAARLDFLRPYSGSRAAAEYILSHDLQRKRINAVDYHAFAVQPYFPRSIFANYADLLPGAFWIWSDELQRSVSVEHMLAGNPDYILIDWKLSNRALGAAILPLYEVDQVFPGDNFWKGRVLEPDSYVLFRRRSQPVSGGDAPVPAATR